MPRDRHCFYPIDPNGRAKMAGIMIKVYSPDELDG